MLTVNGVKKAFGRHLVLCDVSFSLRSGECVGLIGPSGGGKSVLLKILARVMVADRGTVSWGSQTTSESLAPRVGLLFQEGALFDSQTVLENVAFPLCNSGAVMADIDADTDIKAHSARIGIAQAQYRRAYEMLVEVGLGRAVDKFPGQLSGGMRRRVGIARALVHRPELLLLDDPTGGLDPVAATTIINLIMELHACYHPTVIMVSHDIRRLLPNVNRTLALFDGRIVYQDKPEVIPARAPDYVFRFLATRYDFSRVDV